MEVCEQNEAFVQEDRELVFSHTKVILRKGDQYYYATTRNRYRTTSEVVPGSLKLHPIPTSKIWPQFKKGFTVAPKPLPPGCYVKQPSLLHYGDTKASTEQSSLLLQEARVCETLKKRPHPNIAQYLGCIVSNDGRIKGLCFVKYGVNLFDRVNKDTRPFDGDLCSRRIEDGIQHLHSLGLIHCDINPTNIMMDGDNPVIVDFDSCRQEGQKLGSKAGTEGWTSENFHFARRENDQYGLLKIREFLSQGKRLQSLEISR